MFTQECFIRKNSNVLRRKLRNIGYLDNTTINYNKKLIAILGDNYYTYKDYEHFCKLRSESYISRCIDCGDNEELFLAIAALRDDSNEHQWYTDGTRWDFNKLGPKYDWMIDDSWHKATVKELIEHFNNKKDVG